MKLTRLDYTVLVVEDLDRSLAFYSDVLGLPLSHRSGGYAQYITGPTRLSLYSRESMAATIGQDLRAPEADAPGFEIGFAVDDVDEAFRVLVERGATVQQEPTDRYWGQRTAYLRDPDGHLIELVQQIGSARL